MLCCLATDNLHMSSIYGKLNVPLTKMKLERDIDRLFMTIMQKASPHPKFMKLVRRYNLPFLFFSVMSQSQDMVENFFDYKDALGFVKGNHVVSTLIGLIEQGDTIPNLLPLFDTARKYFINKYKEELSTNIPKERVEKCKGAIEIMETEIIYIDSF